jgi:hypothetical protein
MESTSGETAMGKMIGILLVVLGVWVGMEVYTEGTKNAFGGRIAFLSDGEGSPGDGEAPVQRVGTNVQRDHDEAKARRERLLSD